MRILNAMLILAITCHAGGCSRSDSQKEVDKARAETEAARADAAAAKAELAEIRAASPKAATEPSQPQPKAEPAVNPTTKSVSKRGLRGTGVATFADGKKRLFVELWYSAPPQRPAGYEPFGGGETPLFKLQELLLLSDGSGYNVIEKAIMSEELSRMSFGPMKKLNDDPSGEYCDLELESIDGKRETFPCVLQNLTLIVRYADGIGKEKLTSDRLCGMTFRADE